MLDSSLIQSHLPNLYDSSYAPRSPRLAPNEVLTNSQLSWWTFYLALPDFVIFDVVPFLVIEENSFHLFVYLWVRQGVRLLSEDDALFSFNLGHHLRLHLPPCLVLG